MSMHACVCARVYMCVCVQHSAPQTEVRGSLEQVQIELNLIPHCAGTGMKLHNCTLIDDRTPPSPRPPPPPFPSPPPLLFPSFHFSTPLSVSLCVLGLKFSTQARRRDYLLASTFSSFLSVPVEASNNVCLSNQEVNVVKDKGNLKPIKAAQMLCFSFIALIILEDCDFGESYASSFALERISIMGRKDSVSPPRLITHTHTHTQSFVPPRCFQLSRKPLVRFKLAIGRTYDSPKV